MTPSIFLYYLLFGWGIVGAMALIYVLKLGADLFGMRGS